ncbi:MAG: phosphate acyltransferase PlsX [Planctomycetota bacterium]|jgi:glycerol-3-phosphate acyltransferase PlsX
MRIGVDAMGGDLAPVEQIKGALAARKRLAADDKIVLIGHKTQIRQHLRGFHRWEDFLEIHHAEDIIGMDEPPVETLREKPNSSLAVMAEMHRSGELDACISAGNTGAFVAAAQMRLRRLRGAHRPGIAIITPTFKGPVAICDVGANVNCRPRHLHQYGTMASIYLDAVCGTKDPRVALLSVGQEDAKGNELVRRTHELFRSDPKMRFVGNVEGRDLFRGVCDLIVCDGFVGNVVLKLVEGMAESVITGLTKELTGPLKGAWGLLGGKIKKTAKAILTKYDFNEYGGAPLLGVNGICIICHGASDYRGIMNAVAVAKNFAEHRVNEKITERLSAKQEMSNG